MDTKTSSENQKERVILEDIDADGRIMDLNKWDVKVWTGFVCFTILSSDELL
jgi:hypothetical protein